VKQALFLTLWMILLPLTGCTANTVGIDSGLFTDEPCKAPCWNNLTPGVSTANDVDLFIQGLSREKWPARNTLVYQTGCKLVDIADKPGTTVNAFVRMNVDNDKLTFIQSVHDNMPNLRQIVDHLGPPEYYEAQHVIGPDGEFYMLSIYYPKQGVAFAVSVNFKDLGLIKPDMVVSDIQYFEPGDLHSYFWASYSCALGQQGAESHSQREIPNFIQPWSGFGEVKVIQTR
jgi:hypothetical protein